MLLKSAARYNLKPEAYNQRLGSALEIKMKDIINKRAI